MEEINIKTESDGLATSYNVVDKLSLHQSDPLCQQLEETEQGHYSQVTVHSIEDGHQNDFIVTDQNCGGQDSNKDTQKDQQNEDGDQSINSQRTCQYIQSNETLTGKSSLTNGPSSLQLEQNYQGQSGQHETWNQKRVNFQAESQISVGDLDEHLSSASESDLLGQFDIDPEDDQDKMSISSESDLLGQFDIDPEDDQEKLSVSSESDLLGQFDIDPEDYQDSGWVIYDRQRSYSVGEMNHLITQLMQRMLAEIDEFEPLTRYIHQKFEIYQSFRRHDTLSIVGSFGNGLFLPEKNVDGSYHLELDVLYERPMSNLVVPEFFEQIEDHTPVVSLETDTLEGSLSKGSVLLCLTKVLKEMSADTCESFFKFLKENGQRYLSSNAYRGAIPSTSDRSILGEREMIVLEAPLLQPLFRTFRSDMKTISLAGKQFKFMILIDKVAAISVPWPEIASRFPLRKRVWPAQDVITEVFRLGSHVIHNPTNSNSTYGLQWKYTFSTSEQFIAHHFTSSQRAVFLLLKQLKRTHLDFGTFETGESRSGLTTYHLKTVMFWVSETLDQNLWQTEPFCCLIQVLKKLEKCLQDSFCPHYFIPEINVLESAWKPKKLWQDEQDWLKQNGPMRDKLLIIVRKMIHSPDQYLGEYLLSTVDEKHIQESQKETVKPNDEMLNIYDQALQKLMDEKISKESYQSTTNDMTTPRTEDIQENQKETVKLDDDMLNIVDHELPQKMDYQISDVSHLSTANDITTHRTENIEEHTNNDGGTE